MGAEMQMRSPKQMKSEGMCNRWFSFENFFDLRLFKTVTDSGDEREGKILNTFQIVRFQVIIHLNLISKG